MDNRLGRQIQGDLGEQSRIKALGGKAFNLNRLTKGANAPLVDLATDKSFESVKVYDKPKKYVGHLCDLQATDKWASSKQIGLLNKAAKVVSEAARNGHLKLPKGLTTKSSHEAVKNNLREKTVIAVPDDHVGPARRYLLQHIKENPEVWGVKPGDRKAIANRFKGLKNRIQGCGRSYGDILQETVAETNRRLQAGKPSTAGKPPGKPPAAGKPNGPYARPQPAATAPGPASAAKPAGQAAPAPASGRPSASPPGPASAAKPPGPAAPASAAGRPAPSPPGPASAAKPYARPQPKATPPGPAPAAKPPGQAAPAPAAGRPAPSPPGHGSAARPGPAAPGPASGTPAPTPTPATGGIGPGFGHR